MFAAAEARLLPDGRRLHLSQGPIDLVIEAFGPPDEITAAYRRAEFCFRDILTTLVAELPDLRKPVVEPAWQPVGPVAQRMMKACWPHRENFVTPMAAVAGSVADEVLKSLAAAGRINKAYVNNGGDIAFYLGDGESLTAGIVGDYHLPNIDATCDLTSDMAVRGVATSGWKGRSHSLGIADAVTVLAVDAAAADVAATLIANAVDADHPAITREAACDVDPDSDLGDRMVTTDVGALDKATIDAALEEGAKVAETLRRAGLIEAAVLVLQQEFRTVGALPAGLLTGET